MLPFTLKTAKNNMMNFFDFNLHIVKRLPLSKNLFYNKNILIQKLHHKKTRFDKSSKYTKFVCPTFSTTMCTIILVKKKIKISYF